MAVSGVVQLANLIPEIWSQQFYAELRKNLVFAGTFERAYEGEIKAFGDTVNQ